MNKYLISAAGILGFLGVGLGAFGSHILENQISLQMMETYKTGILYHLIHSVALLAISLYGNKRFNTAGYFFIAGIILFSFSLYLYSLTGVKFFAMVTPAGGISFLSAWAMVIIPVLKKGEKS